MVMHTIDKIAWIHIEDRKVLSTRSANSSVWFLPGGKRDPLENDMEALTREIKEELDVELDLSKLHYVGVFEAQAANHAAGVKVKMSCYSTAYFGNLKASSEIAEISFFSMKDLGRVSPVDKIIFDFLYQEGLID